MLGEVPGLMMLMMDIEVRFPWFNKATLILELVTVQIRSVFIQETPEISKSAPNTI